VLTRTLGRVPARRPDLRVDLLTRLAATERHLGRTEASMALIDACEAIVRSRVGQEAVPDAPRIRLLRQRAMTLLQQLEAKDARRAAHASVRLAKKARLRSEVISSLGAEGLAALAEGDAQRAVLLFEESVALTLIHRPSDVARSRAYLVDALGKLGKSARAKRQYTLALEEARADTLRGRGTKEAWVRTSYACALLSLGAPKEAFLVLDDITIEAALLEPLPGLKARRYRALAMLGMPDSHGSHESALRLLEGSPDAYTGLEATLHCVAYVNVLYALRVRLLREEQSHRWHEALNALPLSPRIKKHVATLREPSQRKLGTLDALLDCISTL
jgi:tetratricopeptide (TPR) repeat protein